MIKILFSPGCYGTYLSRCLYTYTNLSPTTPTPIDFDFCPGGSSHAFRKNIDAKKLIWQGHLEIFTAAPLDRIILILPDKHHCLDYYNNQFHKQEKQELVTYILSQLTLVEINHKLKTGWGYTKSFDKTVPRWILREFFSMWIANCFSNGYSATRYNTISAHYTINAQDIILNFNNAFNTICQELKIEITADQETITHNHKNFLKSQRYLNSQLNCEKWVNDIIKKENSYYMPQTIFDEAYIQHVFRLAGYEIKCDGLNSFPTSSIEMGLLIYENSNNYN